MFIPPPPPPALYYAMQDGLELLENEQSLLFRYGSHPEQIAQLFLPEQAAKLYPVVILIHGGCWRKEFGLEGMQAFAHALTQEGIVVWNIEYRRLGNGGGWPETFLDVAAAADYLRTLAEPYQLDLGNVISVGHSAGGHLALWLGVRPQLAISSEVYSPNPLELTGLISLAGIVDLDRSVQEDVCDGVAQQLMGGSVTAYPERYKQASPEQNLPLGIPQVIIQGRKDSIVALEHVKPYIAKAQALSDDIRLIEMNEARHFDLVSTVTPQWQRVKKAILDLLER